MSTKKPSLPLKPTLAAADTNQFDYLSAQSAEQQKAFSAWMMMRYLSSSTTAPEHYLLMVNSLVNTDFSVLRNHPDLQWKLLCVCGTGHVVHHPWIAPGRRQQQNPALELLRAVYPAAKTADLQDLSEIMTTAQLTELAHTMNWDSKQIKKLKS